jgi:hypothetical protein
VHVHVWIFKSEVELAQKGAHKVYQTYNVAVRKTTVCQIQALSLICPSDRVVRGCELLIFASRRTSIDLHLDTVRCRPRRDVETFIAVNL